MSRRILLKNIANGIISSFISRNNDIDGYWGIGKLYSFMSVLKLDTLEVDLINLEINSLPERFQIEILKYSDYLFNQLKAQKIDRNYLNKAKIIIVTHPDNRYIESGIRVSHKLTCKIIITDDLGKEHIIVKNVWCRAHNPTLEMKSTRA